MTESPFQVRGIVEGFYGTYYTFPERNDLIRFAGQHGYNLYVYGPKNDRHHRMRWREPYPEGVMDAFADTVRIAREAGITFCYAISFGVSASYSSQEDFDAITAKLRAFYNRGVRSFSVFLDDIPHCFEQECDRAVYRTSAEAHVDICNRLYDWLQQLDGSIGLSMCPTDYYGEQPFGDYLHVLGRGLHPSVDMYYTGPDVCSPRIAASDAEAFREAARRRPLIWDNYPVNDLYMRSEMHLGPIRGRDGDLHRSVKGVVINPMLEAEASKVAILTYADYLGDPHGYDPLRSWDRALLEVGGRACFGALRLFADNVAHSYLEGGSSTWPLDELAAAALAALRDGETPSRSKAVRALGGYLARLDEVCYDLQYRLSNLALRANLLPWIESLQTRVWVGTWALSALRAMESGQPHERFVRRMEESLTDAKTYSKRTAGGVLGDLAEFARQQAVSREQGMPETTGAVL